MNSTDQIQSTEQSQVTSTANQAAEEGGPGFAELGAMLLLAMGKDALDVALDLAVGIGIVINRITNLFAVAIFWFWCLMRLHRFPTKRFLAAGGIKFIPLLDGLPLWTAFFASLIVKKTIQTFGPANLEQALKTVGKIS